MKRKLSDCDSQHNGSREKRHKILCADTCAPRASSPSSTSSHTTAPEAHFSPQHPSDRIKSWLLSKDCHSPPTPPPDVEQETQPHPNRTRAMSWPVSSHRSGSPKRPRTDNPDDARPDQSASETKSNPLVFTSTNTFVPPLSQISSGFQLSSSRSSSTRSRSESPRKPATTREDQLSSFVPSVEFAALDQAQRYKVHIPESLLSLVKQFEVCTLPSYC